MNDKLSKLFITFFKIGLFTFGGGYAMISLVKENCVEKNKWITEEEFLNMIAVAESTPGPIAINMATYVGLRRRKLLGAITTTLGVILPSMIIIYLISLFFKDLFKIKLVEYAFYGIRIAVSMIIIRVGINLFLQEYKNTNHKNLNIIITLIVFVLALLPFICDIRISTIYIIIAIMIFSLIYAYYIGRKYDIA